MKYIKSEKLKVKSVKLIILIFFFSPLFAVDNQKLIDCYEIFDQKKAIQNLIAKNQKILDEIKKIKMDKITQSYAKMKPKNAANILSNMPSSDAVDILNKLPPKIISKILAKMDPMQAAKLTEILQKGETNTTSKTTPNSGS